MTAAGNTAHGRVPEADTASARMPAAVIALVWLLGAFVFIVLVAGPPLAQMLLLDPGMAWLPIARIDYLPSDEFYSYEIVGDLIDAGTLPLTSAQAYDVLPTWENKRFATLDLAALTSLVVPDARTAILGFLVLAGALYFCVPMAVGWMLSGRVLAGLLGAVLLLVAPDFWTEATDADASLARGDLAAAGASMVHAIEKTLYYLSNPIKAEYAAQTFRLPFPGVPILVLLVQFAAGILVFRRPGALSLAALLVVSLIAAFAYQPVFIAACILLFSFFVVAFASRELVPSALFAAAGSAMLAFIYFSGYVPDMVADVQAHSVGSHLTSASSGSLADILASIRAVNAADLPAIIVHRFTVVGLLLLAIVWPSPLLRRALLVLIAAFIIIKAVTVLGILPPDYAGRLGRRALDPVWMFMLGVCLWYGWVRLASAFDADHVRRAIVVAGGAVVVMAYVWPLSTFSVRAVEHARAGTYAIPSDQREMLRWVDDNASDDMIVVADDWTDIHYVRIFTAAETAYASIMNTGRSTEAETLRYLSAMRALGLDEARLLERFRKVPAAHEAYYDRYRSYLIERGATAHPVHFGGPQGEFVSAWIFEALLRPDWFPEMFGVPVLKSGDSMSPDFLRAVAARFRDASPIDEVHPDAGFLLVRRKAQDYPAGGTLTCETAFENETYLIEQCISG